MQSRITFNTQLKIAPSGRKLAKWNEMIRSIAVTPGYDDCPLQVTLSIGTIL